MGSLTISTQLGASQLQNQKKLQKTRSFRNKQCSKVEEVLGAEDELEVGEVDEGMESVISGNHNAGRNVNNRSSTQTNFYQVLSQNRKRRQIMTIQNSPVESFRRGGGAETELSYYERNKVDVMRINSMDISGFKDEDRTPGFSNHKFVLNQDTTSDDINSKKHPSMIVQTEPFSPKSSLNGGSAANQQRSQNLRPKPRRRQEVSTGIGLFENQVGGSVQVSEAVYKGMQEKEPTSADRPVLATS